MISDIKYFENMPEDVYRAAEGISYSQLKYCKTPAHFIAAKNQPTYQTDEMLLGTLLHELIFTTEENYVVKPKGMSFTSKKGKLWRKNQTQRIITSEMDASLKGMLRSICESKASDLLRATKKEVSAFGKHSSGLAVKGRADMVGVDKENLTFLVDLKTCRDASPREFARTTVGKYHRQAAMYCDLWGCSAFGFIAVEVEPPYAVKVYWLDERSIDQGRFENNWDLNRLAECYKTNVFPAYGEHHESISIPEYMFRS